jgi:threonine dehydrogenase-like Zn-dependent dehydrogenase
VRRNRERAGLLITHRFPLEEAPQALQFALERPTEAEKVMILMGEIR